MVRSLLVVLFALCVPLLPACKKAKPVASASAPKPVRPLTDEETKQLADWGREMATQLGQGKTAGLVEAFDLKRMVDQALDGQMIDQKLQHGLLGGLRTGLVSSFTQFKAAHVKMMRAGNQNGVPCCLIRVLTDEGGMTYLEFQVDPDTKPDFKIIDMENPIMGGKFTDRIASVLAVALKDTDASLVDRIFRKKPSADAAASRRLMSFYALLQQGKFTAIDAAYKGLAKADQDTWHVACAWALAARAEGGQPYTNALADLATRFGEDPAAQFVLLDHYATKGDWKRCEQSIALLSKRYGPDGHLESLRATMLLQDGRTDEARAASRQATELEPDLPEVWDSAALLAVHVKDYPKAVESLTRLEKANGSEIDLDGLRAANPDFALFLDSPEAKAWLEKRGK